MNYATHHKALLEKREELTKLLSSREEIQIESKLPDHLDEALASSARTVAVDAINRNHKLLKDVQHALDRLGEFSDLPYGLCEVCEEEIAENRLNSVPWARLCINCQVELEQREKFEPSLSTSRRAADRSAARFEKVVLESSDRSKL